MTLDVYETLGTVPKLFHLNTDKMLLIWNEWSQDYFNFYAIDKRLKTSHNRVLSSSVTFEKRIVVKKLKGLKLLA